MTRKGGAGRGRMIVVTMGDFREPAPQILIWGPAP